MEENDYYLYVVDREIALAVMELELCYSPVWTEIAYNNYKDILAIVDDDWQVYALRDDNGNWLFHDRAKKDNATFQSVLGLITMNNFVHFRN